MCTNVEKDRKVYHLLTDLMCKKNFVLKCVDGICKNHISIHLGIPTTFLMCLPYFFQKENIITITIKILRLTSTHSLPFVEVVMEDPNGDQTQETGNGGNKNLSFI